jgi:hypothetical protein
MFDLATLIETVPPTLSARITKSNSDKYDILDGWLFAWLKKDKKKVAVTTSVADDRD